MTRQSDVWQKLFDEVALAAGCLPSSFADGNDHVLTKVRRLAADKKVPPGCPPMGKGWSVTVQRDGREELTLHSGGYCGRRDLNEELIVGAAMHLLGFVGYGLPSSDFNPDEGAATITGAEG